MMKSLRDLYNEKGIDYKGITDGYGVIGDCIYKNDECGWWDYGCTGYCVGKLPMTLKDFLMCVDDETKVLRLFKEFQINIIACYCCGCHGALPMIRFFEQKDTEPNHVHNFKDSVSQNHSFRVIRNENNIFKSRLEYLGKMSAPEIQYSPTLNRKHAAKIVIPEACKYFADCLNAFLQKQR